MIPDSKTEAGRRRLQVPETLRGPLVALTRGKRSDELLFGRHWSDWPRKWVERICPAARLPEVTAHGMRGLHSTLAVESGITSHAVAAALGHESFTTTRSNYAAPEALASAQQRRVAAVLEEPDVDAA
jgi:integrase